MVLISKVKPLLITLTLFITLVFGLSANTNTANASEGTDESAAQTSETRSLISDSNGASVSNIFGDISHHISKVAEQAAQDQIYHEKIDTLLTEAKSHQGTPYRFGGNTPAGFDCSGFVQYVYKTALGIDLPRTSYQQGAYGTSVSLNELKEGDLLFWGSSPTSSYHVAIYTGNGTYIHAPHSGDVVRVQSMDYYMPNSAKRLIAS